MDVISNGMIQQNGIINEYRYYVSTFQMYNEFELLFSNNIEISSHIMRKSYNKGEILHFYYNDTTLTVFL